MAEFIFGKRVFPYLILIVVALLISIVFLADKSRDEDLQRLTKNGYIRSAEILKITRHYGRLDGFSKPDELTIRYTYNGKEKISTVLVKMGIFYSEPQYRVGEYISVVYDPLNPDVIDFPNYGNPHPILYSTIFFSTLFAGTFFVGKIIARWNATEA